MSEIFDGGELYEPEGEDNPFLGSSGWDALSMDDEPEIDPYEQQEEEVLRALRIEDFGGLLVLANSVDASEIRGNRFSDFREAILYLSDAGLLGFSHVVIFDNGEIGVSISGSP